MSNEAIMSAKLAVPTLEVFQSILSQTLDINGTAEVIPASNLANRKAALVQNKSSSANVYLGSSNAVTADTDNTTTGGYKLAPGNSIFMTVDGSVTLWVISDTANAGVAIIEFA